MRKNRQVLVSALLCALCLQFAASRAEAQVLYGSILGDVTDVSKPAVPGAAVRITNRETNQSRVATTNDGGVHSFPTIPGGTYDVTISKQGFQTFTERGVEVGVDKVVRVDASLPVGAMTETVRVTGAAAALQTDRAEVRAEVTTQDLQNLPTTAPSPTTSGCLTSPPIKSGTNSLHGSGHSDVSLAASTARVLLAKGGNIPVATGVERLRRRTEPNNSASAGAAHQIVAGSGTAAMLTGCV